MILYVPVLERPSAPFALPLKDWLIIVAAALTVSPVLELTKWIERRWFAEMR